MSSAGRLRSAELTAGSGALILGIGVGALAGDRLTGLGPLLVAAGGVAHAWGMPDKHRQERAAGQIAPWWGHLAYWICWAGLAAISVLIAARISGS